MTMPMKFLNDFPERGNSMSRHGARGEFTEFRPLLRGCNLDQDLGGAFPRRNPRPAQQRLGRRLPEELY
jgi:hypothetical protein